MNVFRPRSSTAPGIMREMWQLVSDKVLRRVLFEPVIDSNGIAFVLGRLTIDFLLFGAGAEYMDLFVECNYKVLGPETDFAFERLVLEGRDGKGIIIIFSGGNQYGEGSDTNFDGYKQS